MKRLRKTFASTEEFEQALLSNNIKQDGEYVLRLYITGMTQRSTEAFASIRAICEKHLAGRYDLEVIDIYLHPELASEEQIIAAPTLIKKLPVPLRRLIGNLAQEERVLAGLDLIHRT